MVDRKKRARILAFRWLVAAYVMQQAKAPMCVKAYMMSVIVEN